jgi:hypothetical protein
MKDEMNKEELETNEDAKETIPHVLDWSMWKNLPWTASAGFTDRVRKENNHHEYCKILSLAGRRTGSKRKIRAAFL